MCQHFSAVAGSLSIAARVESASPDQAGAMDRCMVVDGGSINGCVIGFGDGGVCTGSGFWGCSGQVQQVVAFLVMRVWFFHDVVFLERRSWR